MAQHVELVDGDRLEVLGGARVVDEQVLLLEEELALAKTASAASVGRRRRRRRRRSRQRLEADVVEYVRVRLAELVAHAGDGRDREPRARRARHGRHVVVATTTSSSAIVVVQLATTRRRHPRVFGRRVSSGGRVLLAIFVLTNDVDTIAATCQLRRLAARRRFAHGHVCGEIHGRSRSSSRSTQTTKRRKTTRLLLLLLLLMLMFDICSNYVLILYQQSHLYRL